MIKKCLILFSLALLFAASGLTQEKYSKVKIPVNSGAVKQFIVNSLNADHFTSGENAVTIVLNKEEMNRLLQAGFAFELLVDDVVQQTILENRYTTPLASVAPVQSSSCQQLTNIIPVPVSFGNGGSFKLGAAASNPCYFTYATMIS